MIHLVILQAEENPAIPFGAVISWATDDSDLIRKPEVIEVVDRTVTQCEMLPFPDQLLPTIGR